MDGFMEIEYTGKVKRTGDIFDTTDKEKAKDEDIYNEKLSYGAKLVTDEEELVDGVTEALEEMDEGEEKHIEVPPEKGYGKRDSSKIDMVPKKDFEDTDVTPVPGLRVVLDGQPAKIQTVSGGRVRVDFNNPLAGKDLEYDLKIIRRIKKDDEKAKVLLSDLTDCDEDEVEVEETEDKVNIFIPSEEYTEDFEKAVEKIEEQIKDKTGYEEVDIQEKEPEKED